MIRYAKSMYSAYRHKLLTTLLASAVSASACASTSGMARPSPFPMAPAPPASIRPTAPPALEAHGVPDLPAVIRTALGLRGLPYRLGGESPVEGFDCSGFVRYVFSRNQLPLPRTVTELWAIGSKVRVKDVRAGDLLFFSTTAPGASHVGIAVGDGAFIHAPGAKGAVRVEHLEAPYWHDRFVGAKRVI